MSQDVSQYKIEAGTGQHIGDRAEQQDRIALFNAPRAPGYMMAVLADGMGGASGGRIAAEQAIATAQQVFKNFSPLTDEVEPMLHQIVAEIHTVISLMTLASEMRPQTTVALLVLTPEKNAIWAHAGDSRIYRFAGPNLVERTTDHAGVAPMPNATSSRVLHNVVGDVRITPALTIGRHAGLQPGDAFMLCSDGLWQYIEDIEFGPAIAMNSPRDAAQMLIRKARERATDGDADNCTLGIVKLVALPKEIRNYEVGKMRRAV